MNDNDCISRSALYEKTAEWEAQALHMLEHDDKAEWRNEPEWRKFWSTVLAERSAFKFDVADAPAVNVKPVVKGKWITNFCAVNGHSDIYCSVCNKDATYFVGSSDEIHWSEEYPVYCPNCGADMRKEKDNGEKLS